MLRIHYSNQLEALAAKLIAAADPRADLRAPAQVLVADHQSARYLTREWARSRAICAGIQFIPFAQYYAELRQRPLRAEIRDRLVDSFLFGDVPQPVTAYLGEDDDSRAWSRRLLQLADELSRHFDGYLRYRAKWFRAGTLADAPLGSLAWQAPLWNSLTFDAPVPEASTAPLFVFHRSFWSQDEVRLLTEQARQRPIEVFQLNPCREFWEDGSAVGPLQWLGGRAATSVRLLNRATDYEFVPSFAEAKNTALGRLQHSLLAAKAPSDEAHTDDTLQLWRMPSMRREVEVAADAIWHLVDEHGYQFSDIALRFPASNATNYSCFVREVFHLRGRIPHHFLDVPAAEERDLSNVFVKLLRLPLGNYERPDVLAVVTHRAVFGASGGDEVTQWAEWADELGIFHGIDHRDHQETYIVGDRFNWEQGMRRLALGAFMETPRYDDPGVVMGNQRYAPREIATSEVANAGAFVGLLREMLQACRRAATQRLSRRAWQRRFLRWLNQFFRPTSEFDDRELALCRQALEIFADESPQPLPYAIASDLVIEEIVRLRTSSRGEFGSYGVSVGPLKPQRSRPHKAVIILGLSESTFPAPATQSQLDARSLTPTAEDVSAADRDKTALLESLLSAREFLLMSHVARDEQTGDASPPAPLFAKLADAVGGGWRIARLRDYQEPAEYPFAHANPRAVAAHTAALSGTKQPSRPISAIGEEREEGDVEIPISALRRFLESPLQGWAGFAIGLPESQLEAASDVKDEEFEIAGSYLLVRNIVTAHLCSPRSAIEVLHAEAVAALERQGRAPTGALLEMEKYRHSLMYEAWLSRLDPSAVGHCTMVHVGRPTVPMRAPVVDAVTFARNGGATARIVGSLYPYHEHSGAVLFAPASAEYTMNIQRLRGYLDAMMRRACGQKMPESFLVVTPNTTRRFAVAHASVEQAQLWLGKVARALVDENHDYLMPADPAINWLARGKGTLYQTLESAVESRRPPSCQYGPVNNWRSYPVQGDSEVARERLGPIVEGTEEIK